MAGKRPSTRAILLTISVFLLGVVVGGLGVHLAGHMRETRRVRIIDRLTRTLQLSADQQKKVEAILADGRKRYDEVNKLVREQARPQYDAVHTEIRSRIRAVLTPEQQTKFDDFLKKLDAERKAREQQSQSH